MKIHVLYFILAFLIVGCYYGVIGPIRRPVEISKTKPVPEEWQHKYRNQKPDTTLLVFLKDRSTQNFSRWQDCVFLFEKSDILSEEIKIQKSRYRYQEHIKEIPFKARYTQQYLVACTKRKERLEMYIPLNGKEEKEVILGFGQGGNKEPSRWQGNVRLIVKKITIKRNKPQYYRWGSLVGETFYPIDPNNYP